MPEQTNIIHDHISDEYAKYLVSSRQEIAQILRALSRQNEMVTAYFNRGNEFFLTSIVEVDSASGKLIVDCGSEEETNRRVLAAEKIVFVTNLDRIKIQFNTKALAQINHQGRPAFRTPLPASVLKLQRREYYRLVTPLRAPLHCIIPDLAGARHEVTVADISVGGAGISGLPQEAPLEKGQRLVQCRIVLPDEGTAVSTLEVRSLQQSTLRSGELVLRAGCLFVDIPAAHQAMIQRYIIRIDRERRALVRGS
ncbi:MAG: flagellar brake protein [Hydrogenophilales bacterium]|nr:flagellar brake protein [Hydrogenophilales bacterium]